MIYRIPVNSEHCRLKRDDRLSESESESESARARARARAIEIEIEIEIERIRHAIFLGMITENDRMKGHPQGTLLASRVIQRFADLFNWKMQ